MLYKELSNKLIGVFFEVHSLIGPGLLEKNYHNGLYIKLKEHGFDVKYKNYLPVFMDKHRIGEYYPDIMLENKIIIEVKAVKKFDNNHRAQLINYLHISGCRLGFLVNFYPSSCIFERLVL